VLRLDSKAMDVSATLCSLWVFGVLRLIAVIFTLHSSK
jgi:hypothetical protein